MEVPAGATKGIATWSAWSCLPFSEVEEVQSLRLAPRGTDQLARRLLVESARSSPCEGLCFHCGHRAMHFFMCCGPPHGACPRGVLRRLGAVRPVPLYCANRSRVHRDGNRRLVRQREGQRRVRRPDGKGGGGNRQGHRMEDAWRSFFSCWRGRLDGIVGGRAVAAEDNGGKAQGGLHTRVWAAGLCTGYLGRLGRLDREAACASPGSVPAGFTQGMEEGRAADRPTGRWNVTLDVAAAVAAGDNEGTLLRARVRSVQGRRRLCSHCVFFFSGSAARGTLCAPELFRALQGDAGIKGDRVIVFEHAAHVPDRCACMQVCTCACIWHSQIARAQYIYITRHVFI